MMSKCITRLSLIFLSLTLAAQAGHRQQAELLESPNEANRMAFVEGREEPALETGFQGDDEPRRTHDSLYQVSKRDEKTGEKRTGFIDKTGKLVIGFDRLPKATDLVGEFYEGRAWIRVKNDKPDGKLDSAGYIDETGEIVIAPRFGIARDFSEGLAYVQRIGFAGFIDRQGREVIKTSELSVGDFHEGLAAVGSRQIKGEWGYIDRSGNLVIKQQYSFADSFSEGLAGVEVNGRYGFINKKGEMVIPPGFVPRKGAQGHGTIGTSRFSEGLACVKIRQSYGYIDKKGDFVIPARFSEAQEFSEGLAWVATSEGKTGWIDKTGRWIVSLDDPSFPFALGSMFVHASQDLRYSEGLVPLELNPGGKYMTGYIDKRGRFAIKPAFIYRASPFVGGVAQVWFYEKSSYAEGKLGFFNKDGQFQEQKYGYITKTGQFIWPLHVEPQPITVTRLGSR